MIAKMNRRQFITLLGGAAVAWPLAARAQQPAKLPTIGYLGTAAASAWAPWTAAFVQRLHELGWTDGRTVAIQYRWAEGRAERSAELAAELARLKVDVIVTGESARNGCRCSTNTALISLCADTSTTTSGHTRSAASNQISL